MKYNLQVTERQIKVITDALGQYDINLIDLAREDGSILVTEIANKARDEISALLKEIREVSVHGYDLR
jgi:hypothetical protein